MTTILLRATTVVVADDAKPVYSRITTCDSSEPRLQVPSPCAADAFHLPDCNHSFIISWFACMPAPSSTRYNMCVCIQMRICRLQWTRVAHSIQVNVVGNAPIPGNWLINWTIAFICVSDDTVHVTPHIHRGQRSLKFNEQQNKLEQSYEKLVDLRLSGSARDLRGRCISNRCLNATLSIGEQTLPIPCRHNYPRVCIVRIQRKNAEESHVTRATSSI